MSRSVFGVLAVAVLTFGFYGQASAQVPSSVEPGVLMQQLDGQDQAPSRLEDIISLPKSQTDGAGASEKKVFVLREVVLDGSDVYNSGDLTETYQGFVGQEVSFADLNRIAQRVTIKYREDGYMFSRAVLPPQKIENGVVRLQAVEGRVTDVKVVGEYTDEFGLIEKMAAKIKSDGPSNTKQLERYLLLIDDLPGITARSVLQPSETPGGGALVIQVEQDNFEGSLSLDNRGSRYIGRYQATGVAAFNSLFNVFDRTTFRWLNSVFANQTDELRFVDVSHEQQVGTDGMRVKGRVAVTSTEPGGSIASLNIDGNSQLLELETLYPVIRSRQFNVNALGGFNHLDSQSKLSGSLISDDRVRSIWVGGRVDFLDTMAGVNQFDAKLTKGVDIFNATDDGTGRSRTNGEHDFLKANLVATRVQDLPGKWSALASVSGQYALDPLLASEEFAVGGASYGRAYDGGEIVGDHGAAGVVEVRYDGPQGFDWVNNSQFYGYYDIGAVWNKDTVFGESGKESLASAGVGMRFNLKNSMTGYVEVDAPLTRGVGSEGSDEDPRLFFSLLKRF